MYEQKAIKGKKLIRPILVKPYLFASLGTSSLFTKAPALEHTGSKKNNSVSILNFILRKDSSGRVFIPRENSSGRVFIPGEDSSGRVFIPREDSSGRALILCDVPHGSLVETKNFHPCGAIMRHPDHRSAF